MFSDTANDLLQAVDAALSMLRSLPEGESERPRAPGKWSAKQVIGHLIDSASNNHQRFVRAQQESALIFPGYDQDHWVGCQDYAGRPWQDLTALWAAYNRHLAHVIARIPEHFADVRCTIGGGAPVTLAYLAQDYVVHLRHHLTQIADVRANRPGQG